jgi:hypothetical protein
MTNAQEAGGPMRFRDRTIAFGGLAAGRDIEIPSASPVNYHQVISKPADMPPVTIDGKLFLPASDSASRSGGKGLPLVMIVPGSLGVAPSHLAHAETLTRAGFATFVLEVLEPAESPRQSPTRRSSRSPPAPTTCLPHGRFWPAFP